MLAGHGRVGRLGPNASSSASEPREARACGPLAWPAGALALPRLERAFLTGPLGYSRVRELTRVATATDEEDWLELGLRLPMRELERRVAVVRGRPPPETSPCYLVYVRRSFDEGRRGLGS